MRTTLNLDNQALEAAQAAMPGKTTTDVVNEALRQMGRKHVYAGFREFKGIGWEGNLDELRGRTPRTEP